MLLYQYWMAVLITDSVLTQICGLSTSHTHGHWLRTFTAVPTTQPYIPSWSLNWVLALAGVWVGMSPLPGDWWCCGMWVSVAVRLVNFCTSDSHSLKGSTSVNQNRFIQCCKWQLNKKELHCSGCLNWSRQANWSNLDFSLLRKVLTVTRKPVPDCWWANTESFADKSLINTVSVYYSCAQ